MYRTTSTDARGSTPVRFLAFGEMFAFLVSLHGCTIFCMGGVSVFSNAPSIEGFAGPSARIRQERQASAKVKWGIMKKIWFVGLAVATLLATAPAANADSVTYNFSLNGAAVAGADGGPAIEGSGLINLNPISGGYNLASISQFYIDGYSASIIGNPSPGNVSSYYINGQYAATSCSGATDYCITFDNKLTSVAPGTSPAIKYPGGLLTLDSPGWLLFQYTEGGNPVELIIWLDNVSSDPYYGDYLWNEFVGAGGKGGYGSGGYWVVPLSADNGQGGIPLDLYIGPEPPSLLLLGTGLLSMAGFIFWKSRPSMVKVK